MLYSPQELTRFAPSAERARFLDRRMRTRLAESLRHVFDQSEGHFPFSREDAEAFLLRLEAQAISPLAFSTYADLVLAIDADRLEQAAQLVDELVAMPSLGEALEIMALPDAQTSQLADRYIRYVNTDSATPFDVIPPSLTDFETCRAQIEKAFDLLESGASELAHETRALLRQIVLASQSPAAREIFTFDGASSSMLWGAILINADRKDSVFDMAQVLVHESTHNLIFGLSVDEPLLKNSPEERYTSPLRPDPRPIEGIYHATYVIARMHLTVGQLLQSGRLSPTDEAQAKQDLTRYAGLFAEGFSTLQLHARFTGLGSALMEEAERSMSTV